jgi:hypothetical protein
MFRDRSRSTNLVDARLSALADDAMTRRLVASHPALYGDGATAIARRACTSERVKTPMEPALFVAISIVLALWLASLAALLYGIAVRQLAHPASAGVGAARAAIVQNAVEYTRMG